MIIINDETEMEKYLDEATNTYALNDDVTFTENIDTSKNIYAQKIFTRSFLWADNINAWDITAMSIACAGKLTAHDIYAGNIRAKNIYARDIMCNRITSEKISYENICCAKEKINCNDINGKYASSIAVELKLDIVPNYIKNSEVQD